MSLFLSSSFGSFLLGLFGGILSAPSWESFVLLAYGWSVARGRYFVSTFIWLSGGVRFKHFSRFYYFLGGAFCKARERFWGSVIVWAARLVPEDQAIRVKVDDENQKCTGRRVEGAAQYRNSAGTARQEFRTLFGLNFVHAVMSVPLPLLPGQFLSVPVGLELYLKASVAKRLGRAPASRSALARKMVDFLAQKLPHRKILSVGDGGYATKEYLQDRPTNLEVVSRLMVSAKLYEGAPSRASRKGCGRPPVKGKLLGSPNTLARTRKGWQPHPWDSSAQIQSWTGLWHTVLPGTFIRAVVVRRRHLPKTSKKKAVEAFFSTDLSLSAEQILSEFAGRWDIEIDIRDGNEFYGLGHSRCRKHDRILGANTLCAVLAAARTLWFLQRLGQRRTLDLTRFRPWYRQKRKPSQLDITWALVECLHAEGISPTVRFLQDLQEKASCAAKRRRNAA